MDSMFSLKAVGSPETVRKKLEEFAEHSGADELIVVTYAYDPERARSLLAGADWNPATEVQLVVLTAAIIFGGLRRVARVAEWVVPFMSVAYLGLAGWVVVTNLGEVPVVLAQVLRSAFGLDAAAGGMLGAIAGRLHNQAQDWQPPAGFVRHAWDEHGLAGRAPFWGRFWDLPRLSPAERRLLVAARDRVFTDLSALPKTRATYSMIHADFCQENLLVDGARVRLIDFDDAGFGWHLFELVTPLYFLMDEPYFDEVRDVIAGGS